MATTRVHSNNYASTLSAAITSTSATSMTVTSATGLPTLSGTNYCNLTLVSGSTIEIVSVTNITGTTLTITRAQEGTTASTFANGSVVSLRTTADSSNRKTDGPSSSTANAIVTYADTSGRVLLNNSGVTITSGVITTGADPSFNTVLVGLGGGTQTTNTRVGVGALAGSNSTGHHVAIGYQALNVQAGANPNVAIGDSAGLAISTGGNSVYVGYQSGLLVATGSQNVSIGKGAMSITGTGSGSCVAIGYLAGNINGSSNVSIGNSCCSGTSLSFTNNVAVGAGIMAAGSSSTGGSQVLIGYTVLATPTTATQNVLIGYQSGNAGTSIANCCFVGYQSGASVTSGASNTMIGNAVGITGGPTGAAALTTGSGNTWIGAGSCGNNLACANTIAIGRNALAIEATGATSSNDGPGISLGSSTFPVGFRGDGSIYPSATSSGSAIAANCQGYMQVYVNGTAYKIPLFSP